MWPLVALGGLGLVSSIVGADKAEDAAAAASASQVDASNASIGEQRRQFDAIRELLAPYVSGGQDAFRGLGAMLGTGGNTAAEIARGDEFQTLLRQGEDAILANASATGGLRGGNVQAALGQFRPQLLNELINQRFQRLATVAGMGQASAAGQAAAGMQMGQNIGQSLQTIGAAQAGGALGMGQARAGMWNGLANAASTFGTMGFLRGGGAVPSNRSLGMLAPGDW